MYTVPWYIDRKLRLRLEIKTGSIDSLCSASVVSTIIMGHFFSSLNSFTTKKLLSANFQTKVESKFYHIANSKTRGQTV